MDKPIRAMPLSPLDSIDIRILSELQKNGPLSKTKLASLVNLSPTPCWKRLNRLRSEGFILGYSAEIALEKLGDMVEVVVCVSLSRHRKCDFECFEKRICEIEEIFSCVSTGGGMDYVLRIACSSLDRFQDVMEGLLNEDLYIERYMTYIATRTIKSVRPNLAVITDKT